MAGDEAIEVQPYVQQPIPGTPFTVYQDGDEETSVRPGTDGYLRLGATSGTWEVKVTDDHDLRIRAEAMAVAWRHVLGSAGRKAPDLLLLDAATELGVRDTFHEHLNWSPK